MRKRWKALGVLVILAVLLTPAALTISRERLAPGAGGTVGIITISGMISLVDGGPLDSGPSAGRRFAIPHRGT